MSLPQPVPPSWKDLGKSSSDLLSKDFPTSGTSLEVKTKTPSNVTFKVAGFSPAHGDKITGDIEAKYIDPKNGMTLTQAWTTHGLLKTNVELENQLAKGLKFELNTALHPDQQKEGRHHGLLATHYKQPGLHSRAFLDIFKGPSFTADTVIGRDGFLIGGEATYNLTDGRISRFAAAAGYSAPEYAVALHGLGNLKTFAASYYHRVNRDVEAGAKAIYESKAPQGGVSLEVGAKAYLDAAAFVKAKVNSTGIVVLGYTQALRPGVKVSAGLALDTQKLSDPTIGGPAHKVGASFTFEG